MSNVQTSCPSVSRVVPDQNKCAQMLTARHWSGFLSNLAAPTAHCDLIGLWLSSVKHVMRCSVAKMSVAAASCALLSLISSSYSVNAFKHSHSSTEVIFWSHKQCHQRYWQELIPHQTRSLCNLSWQARSHFGVAYYFAHSCYTASLS